MDERVGRRHCGFFSPHQKPCAASSHHSSTGVQRVFPSIIQFIVEKPSIDSGLPTLARGAGVQISGHVGSSAMFGQFCHVWAHHMRKRCLAVKAVAE